MFAKGSELFKTRNANERFYVSITIGKHAYVYCLLAVVKVFIVTRQISTELFATSRMVYNFLCQRDSVSN